MKGIKRQEESRNHQSKFPVTFNFSQMMVRKKISTKHEDVTQKNGHANVNLCGFKYFFVELSIKWL